MSTGLVPHPVALLFPDMSAADFAALMEDIRMHGVRVPILVHGGQIMDGRHRYLACCKLGVRCPAIEWNGRDPWFELQSRNLLRRHLAKDQVYAIQKLAAEQYPELAASFDAARLDAKQRKAQAKGLPRGEKGLSRSADRHRESADVIGSRVGVSGSTVKRVERLARIAPGLLKQVASGQISVMQALRRAEPPAGGRSDLQPFTLPQAEQRLRELLASEWVKWPIDHRGRFAEVVQRTAHDLARGALSSGSVRRSVDSSVTHLSSNALGNVSASHSPHQRRTA